MKYSRRMTFIARAFCAALLGCWLTTTTTAQTPAGPPIPVASSPERSAKIRQETFELVWQTVNKTFYDPNFNGVDWKAIHDRYAPRVAAATSDAELYSLLQLMVNELHQSHFWVIAPEEIPKLRPKPKRALADSNEDLAEEPDEESQPETALDLIKEQLADRLSTGIGLDLRVVNGSVLVTRVDSGSPAARAGMRPGAAITSVDGTTMRAALARLENHPVFRDIIRPEIPLVLVAAYLNGESNEPLDLTYLDRRNVRRHLRLLREKLPGEMSEPVGNLPSLYTDFEAKRLADGIGYIRFNAFVPNLMKKVCGAIREMRDAPAMILDLRGNQGGLMGMITGLGGLLSDSTSYFGSMNMRSSRTSIFVMPQRKPYTGPLTILIDSSTLSAAEIFAAGMQQTRRAFVVGDISAGSTLPSAVIKLPTGGLLQYAFGTYETSDGIRLEGRGVVPDLIVKINRMNLLRTGDPQLAASVARLRRQITPRLPNELTVNVKPDVRQNGVSKPPADVIIVAPTASAPTLHPEPAPPAGTADAENARSVQQVLDRYVEALGGEAALLKVTTRVSIGTIELPMGLSGTVEVYEAAPNRNSVFMNLKGFGVLQQTFNGSVRWLHDPVRGYLKVSEGETPADVFPGEVQLGRDAKLYRFAGKEKLGDEECFVLEGKSAAAGKTRLYFSARSGLLVRENDMYYEDYREVDGLQIPFVARQDEPRGLGSIIRLKEVKTNVPIDESKFAERSDCFTRPEK